MLKPSDGVKICGDVIINGDFIVDNHGFIYTGMLCKYKNLFFMRELKAIGRIEKDRLSIFKGTLYARKMVELCDKNVFRYFEVGTDSTLPSEFMQSLFVFIIREKEYFWHNYSKTNKGKEYCIYEENGVGLLHEGNKGNV